MATDVSAIIVDRRQLLALATSLFVQPVFSMNAASQSIFLSAASDPEDRHWLKSFQLEDGAVIPGFDYQLPGRAHHIAVHEESNLFAVVARRPGTFLIFGNIQSGEILQEIKVPEDRHLLGHGVFSENGKFFYAAESDYQDLQGDSGRIVSWKLEKQQNSVSISRVNDFPSYGVGPHEIHFMPDQKTLVIANGGIRTHPDSGREKLNLDSMKPSLVYLDVNTGDLLEQRSLADQYHQSGIRHIDVNANGTVALAMQYEGESFNEIPLVATHHLGGEIRYLEIPGETQRQMNQYVGAVRFDNSGRFFAASCPRGNMITFWDSEENKFIDSVPSRDGCGVAATEDGFIFTAGTGRISYYDFPRKKITSLLLESEEVLFWDNHLTMARN